MMLKNTDNPQVCFRWFRTVETKCDKVFLNLDKKEQALQWDNDMKLYKSQACEVTCGKHVTDLNINGKYYPCKPFTIVPDSFEVHLFLMDVNINGSTIGNYERNASLQVDVSNLDNVTEFPISDLSKSIYYDCQTSFQRRPPVKWEMYEEMLTNKTQEIRSLQSELKRLRLSIVDIYSNNFEEINSSNDDLSALEVESNFEKEENGYNDAKIESDLNININNTQGITSLLESMRTNKAKYLAACKKNQRLQDENLKLQQENIKLRNMLEDNNRADTKNSASDVLCFSEQDTDSTQYHRLPSSMPNIYASKSLPILNTQQTEINLPRRYASFSEVVLSSEGSEEEELCFKVGSSTQTDITALEDPPKQLLLTPKKRSVNSSGMLFNSGAHNYTINSNYANEDSDTEEILHEAENFLIKTLPTFPVTSYSTKRNYSVNDSIVAGSQTVFRNNYFQHTFSQVPLTPIVKAKRTQLRPFLPKSAKDLKSGHVIKYFSSDGRIQQGKVSYLISLPSEASFTIVIEDLEDISLNSSPRRTFVPFKKVILAWEEWN